MSVTSPSIAVALRIFVVGLFFNPGLQPAHSAETLYNGIVLPREWPPRFSDYPTSVERDPAIPPYLGSPPAVIPIDVG